MTLRHIRIFLAVCDHDCNVTRAAQALYMAQPAVSAAIRELEEEYGVRLFDRISRRFSITEAGRRFYQYARQMDALYGDMDREMRGWNTRGLLRVGCSITVGSRMMPEIVRTFGEGHPETEVQVVVEQSEQLEKRLLRNDLDFAVLEGIVHEPGLVGEEFLEDELLPVTAADSSPHGKPFPFRYFSSSGSCFGKKAAVPGRFSIVSPEKRAFPFPRSGRAPATRR